MPGIDRTDIIHVKFLDTVHTAGFVLPSLLLAAAAAVAPRLLGGSESMTMGANQTASMIAVASYKSTRFRSAIEGDAGIETVGCTGIGLLAY